MIRPFRPCGDTSAKCLASLLRQRPAGQERCVRRPLEGGSREAGRDLRRRQSLAVDRGHGDVGVEELRGGTLPAGRTNPQRCRSRTEGDARLGRCNLATVDPNLLHLAVASSDDVVPPVRGDRTGRVVRKVLQAFGIDHHHELVGWRLLHLPFVVAAAVAKIEAERSILIDEQAEPARFGLVELAEDRLASDRSPSANPDLERQTFGHRPVVERLLHQDVRSRMDGLGCRG